MDHSQAYERVIIAGKAYRLTNDEEDLVFERFLFTNEKEIRENGSIVIKKNEILFVRKCTEDDVHEERSIFCLNAPFCSSRSNFRVLNSKRISKLARKESSLNRNGNKNQSLDDLSTKKNDKNCRFILKNSLKICFIVRKNNFRWRLAFIICSFKCEKTADQWINYLRDDVIEGTNRPKNLLVFVNPYGGKKRALSVHKEFVEPIFKFCGINFTVITTQHKNHAKDVVLNEDLSEFDGIISVGGDGLFNEVLNGLLIRTQRDANLDINDKNINFKPASLRLAAIPAGSTNALAYTIHGTDDPLTSVLHTVVGDSRGVDVCSVHGGDTFCMFACIGVVYGFFGDVLRHSENMRWLGPPRYLFAGLKMLLSQTSYFGRIAMKLSDPLEIANLNTNDSEQGNFSGLPNCESCDSACKLCLQVDQIDEQNENRCDQLSPFIVSDQKFVHLFGAINPVISKFAPGGISPSNHLGDGRMHLIVVSPISRCTNGKFITKFMGKRENSNHLQQSYVVCNRVSEFSFNPRPVEDIKGDTDSNNVEETGQISEKRSAKKLGAWNLDGELMAQPEEILHFKLHRQLVTLFARGRETNAHSITNIVYNGK